MDETDIVWGCYIDLLFSKLDTFWQMHYLQTAETDKETISREDNQENILILFREFL